MEHSLTRARGALRAAALAAAAALFALGLTRLHAAPPSPGDGIGRKLSSLRLDDTTGRARSLAEFRDRKALVIVFLGTGCPVANSYAEYLSELATRFKPRGVQFLGVNPNREEDRKTVAQHAAEHRLAFPVLLDPRQALADRLGAKVTPEAFVLDAGRVVRYRGRIDDSYASRVRRRAQAGSRDLETALEQILSGQPVRTPVTAAIGCAIVRPEKKKTVTTAKVTYHKDVAGILQERCQNCHRPGQVAPFSLLTYRDAKSWASEIKEFTANRQMPPWLAEPGHGDFKDVRRLPDSEIATLAAWADAGAPEGDPRDAPPAKAWPEGWMLGKPDLELTVPEPFDVAATTSSASSSCRPA